MKHAIQLLLLLIPSILFSQEPNINIKELEASSESLNIILDRLYSSRNDDEKHTINAELLIAFEKALSVAGSYDYDFPNIKDVGFVRSPDDRFRIVNWNIPLEDGTHEYYGFLQSKQILVRKLSLFKKISFETFKKFDLIDVSKKVSNPHTYTGTYKRWYGMLYYDVIINKTKTKTYYTLLGWDGNDKFSSKKIIDVLTFDSQGTPKFGANIFAMKRGGSKKRVIFEYDASCTMSLKYNKSIDSIVFDHLVPKEIQLEGQYQYYCTDFTYDGFGFEKGKWHYGEYINARNRKRDQDKAYSDPKDFKDAINGDSYPKKGDKPVEKE